jgi:DNA-binding MarR family transcriptional regulator
MEQQPLFRVRDERKPGHHWADNEVLDLHGRELGPYGYAIYMALARHANNSTGKCTKTHGDIARIFGVSNDTVQRAIAKLMELNLITREDRPGYASSYILLEVPKERYVPKGQKELPIPSADSGTPLRSERIPPTPTAVTLPLLADTPTLTADANKEERLIQDSFKTGGEWSTGDLMDFKRLRLAFNTAPRPQAGEHVAFDPGRLETLWRAAAKEAGVPWTRAMQLLSRDEGRDFAAFLAQDRERRIEQKQREESALAREMDEYLATRRTS